ncbi:MAG: DUF4430 domain-containing protein [Cellulosilyticaceae bacterium]
MKQKKRVLSWLLIIVLMIVNSMPSFAQVMPLVISEIGYVNLENGKDAEMSFKARNITIVDQKAHFITALYDEHTNEMIHYNYVVETIPANQEKLWGACMPIPQEGDYKIKVFAWEDMQNLKLLSNVLEVGADQELAQPYVQILKETSTYIAGQTPSAIAAIGGEWSVLGLARAGYPVSEDYYETYYAKVVEAVQKEVVKGRPFGYKVTETQRIAMALTAMGKDATNVGGIDLIDYSWNKAKNFPGLSGTQAELGGRQGLNELIFGLITVDLQQSEQSVDASITRDQIIDKMLTEYRTADGGFALNKGGAKADVDITGMTLQALAPYYDTNAQVKKAVDEALDTLSQLQTPEGGFTAGDFSGKTVTSESTSQVVVALTALNIDPTQDARFIKGENNPITNLLSYYAGDGQFRHTPDGGTNMMATEQCHYALVAYDRLLKGENRLYDMTDVTLDELEKIEVTLNIDRSSIAEATVLNGMGYQETLAQPLKVEVVEGAKVVDVLEAAAIKYGFELKLNDGKNYLEGIDGIHHREDSEIFEEMCKNFGLKNIPDIFQYAGWLYEINHTYGQGITQDTVKNGDEIDFRYTLYFGSSIGGEWINFDWEFVDAYRSLEALINSVNPSDYIGDELVALNQALDDANQVLGTIDEEAQGMWIHYIGQKQTSLWGPGSPTEALVNAQKTLQMAIDKVAQPIGKVSLAIEKRTIGKGDTLTLTEVDLFEGDTAWDVIERETTAREIAVEATKNEQFGSIYISSIDGDGEFDYGSGSGWKYSVNEKFPEVGVSAYDLADGDTVRLRFCVTVGSSELDVPLAELLKTYIQDAKTYKATGYTEASFATLQKAILDAEVIAKDEQYNSMATEKELVVSQAIGGLIEGIKGLEKDIEKPLPPSEIPSDFENNIGLNKDFLEMKIGDEYKIVARRLAEIIDNPIANTITHPKYHYEVVKGNSVSVDETGKVVAIKEGTSIIAVTYDAVTANGIGYDAISPINTGLFVVDVTNGTDTGISIAIQSEEDGVVKQTRSYDTYYFTGDSIDYSFSVAATGGAIETVKVNGQIIAPQGSIYTAPLRNSGNIIEVVASNEKGKEVFAQVVDARKIEINVENLTDPERNDAIEVGDDVKVSFKGITLPVYKLATIYNPSWSSEWEPNGGAKVAYSCDLLGGVIKGKETQYDLATNNAIQFEATKEGTYRFADGHIDEGWWGEPLGMDKEMEGPGDANLGAAHHNDLFSQLPEFSIEVGPAINRPVIGVEIEKNIPEIEVGESYQLKGKVLPTNASEQSLIWSSSNEAIATVDANGKLTGVGAGKATITAQAKDAEVKASVEVTIIPERPATEEEKTSLKQSIERAKQFDQAIYTIESWEDLQAALTDAETIYTSNEVLLEQVNGAKNKLDAAIRGLQYDFSRTEVEIRTETITPGSEVAIYLPQLVKPDVYFYPLGKEIYMIYNSNFEGLKEIQASNAVNSSGEIDEEALRTITFVVPENTTPGVYKINGGLVQAKSFMPPNRYHNQKYYEGRMPEIEITVVAKESNTLPQEELPPTTTAQAIRVVGFNGVGRMTLPKRAGLEDRTHRLLVSYLQWYEKYDVKMIMI